MCVSRLIVFLHYTQKIFHATVDCRRSSSSTIRSRFFFPKDPTGRPLPRFGVSTAVISTFLIRGAAAALAFAFSLPLAFARGACGGCGAAGGSLDEAGSEGEGSVAFFGRSAGLSGSPVFTLSVLLCTLVSTLLRRAAAGS